MSDTGKKMSVEGQQNDEFAAKLFQAIEGGATLKEIENIPDSFMKGIYTYAYDFYNQGRLDDAEVFFRFLSIYDFYNTQYMMGLAAVYQLKKRYEKALELYALAYSMAKTKKGSGDKEEYKALFHAGQCNIMLKKGNQAKQCFEIVIENSGDEDLIKKSNIYIASLQVQEQDKVQS